ncbi:unnamed protein product, partial [Brenthis ino]
MELKNERNASIKMVPCLLILCMAWMVGGDPSYDSEVLPYELSSDDGFPQEGCLTSAGSGDLSMDCTLPSGKASVTINKAATALTLSYEMKSGPLVCDELQQTKPVIQNYTNTRDRANVRMKFFTIKYVILSNESLACPLALLGTDQTETLTLNALKGQLRPSHLEGIRGVKQLYIMNIDSNITSVPYEAMAHFESLERATLTGGAFVLKQEDTILPKLKVLELSRGKLNAIPKRAFKNTPELQMLLLFSNEIEYVDVDAFEGLTQLRNLSLNSNRISVLPARALGAAPRLRRADLYDNSIRELGEGVFWGLDELAMVVLFNNRVQLTLYNRTFANLPSLTELKLEGNSIETLPGDLLSNSTSLKKLYLQRNQLASLPRLLFSGLRLRELDLSSNNLTFLWEEQLRDQDQLESLQLQKNALEHLPSVLFEDTANLKVLDLKHNNISSLRGGVFNKLSQLEQLYLDWNRISELKNVFDGLVKLEVLSLSHNNITISKHQNTLAVKDLEKHTVYQGAGPEPYVERFSPFSGLPRLRTLRLAHNAVALLCDDWRQKFHLQVLDLSHNNITSVSDTDSYFQNSVKVDLSHNDIHTFDPHLYYDMQTLPTLILSKNPFRCSCSLYPFLNKYKSPHKNFTLPILDLDGAKCASPSPLKDVKLTDLQLDSLTCQFPCPSECDSCLKRPNKLQVELTCNKIPRNLTDLPNYFVSYSLKLTNVSTSDRLTLDLPRTVRFVDLSNLNLTAPPVATSVTVDLRNNSLSSIPVRLIENNCSLYLGNNPIECVCENQIDLMTLMKHNKSILDFRTIKCTDNRLIKDIDLVYLCYNRDLAVTIVLLLVSISLMLAICLIIYKNWILIRIELDKLRIWPYKHTKNTENSSDIFLSYAHQDELFVLSRVIPELEKPPGSLRLCVASRDWRLGDTITEQIQRSIRNSSVVLALLSRSYLDSAWCRMEFRLAHTQGKVLVLMMEDFDEKHKELTPDMKAYITSRTYIKESHPLLFEKIREAFAKRQSKEKDGKLKPTGIDTQLDVNGMIFNNALTAPPA